MLSLAGYIASAFIGISLGLIGGGGSILTVPVLVYLFHQDAVLSTSYSLFIVGTTSLAGAIPKYRQGMIDMRTALVFGAPSVISVYLTRLYLVPAIPDVIFSSKTIFIDKSQMMLLLFAVLMVMASVSMIRKQKQDPRDQDNRERHFNYPVILLEGSAVGVLTGLVGAGGGFLIIPALVILSGLTMKKAVGTSLLIIAAKSLIGFAGDFGHFEVDWTFLMTITAVAIGGIFIGNHLSKKIEGERLKKAFGWFILITGIYMILKETAFK